MTPVSNKKESLSQQAYKQIKEMIFSGKFAPSVIFNEAQLQDLLSMGRTPIREAILRLAGEQLLTVHPRRGIEIAKVSPKRIHDLFEIRSMLEPRLLETGFTNIDKGWLSEMREKFLPYCNLPERDFVSIDTVYLSTLDNDFHQGLTSAMGNTYADELFKGFSDYLILFRCYTPDDETHYAVSSREHVAIADAVLTGDAQSASRNLKQHLERSYEEAVSIVMKLSL